LAILPRAVSPAECFSRAPDWAGHATSLKEARLAGGKGSRRATQKRRPITKAKDEGLFADRGEIQHNRLANDYDGL
jgi:hypothetical protein